MKEHLFNIPTPAGAIDTFVTHPAEGGPFPAVILYMDIWGVREELFDVARRIATVGYYCMVPNFYYRQGKVSHEFRNARGQMITLDALDEEKRNKVLAPLKYLSDDMVIEDTRAILAFIDAGQPVRPGGPLGSVGYCMGGRHVFRVAGAFPDRFRASASLHGTDLMTSAADSPHVTAARAQGEVYCGFAAKDRHTPMSMIEGLDKAMRAAGVAYRYEVHPGADHGYALPDRDIFDKQGANRDWEIIFPMFRRQLHPA